MNRRSLIAAAAVLPLTTRLQASTPEATPDAFGEAASRFGDMMDYVPANALVKYYSSVAWMDIERQRAAFGGVSPLDNIQMILPISIPDNVMAHAQEFESMFGFSLDDIQQTVVTGISPEVVRIYRVLTQEDVIEAALQASGYEPIDGASLPCWTIGTDGSFDLTNEIQQKFVAAANNVALLGDGVIAFAPTAEIMNTIIDVALGKSESVRAELDPILTAMPKDAANAWIVGSEAALYEVPRAEEALPESDDAVGPMPAISRIGCGVTVGAHGDRAEQHPEAAAWATLVTDGESEQAASVIEWRIANMMSIVAVPYSELLGETQVEAVNQDTVLVTAHGDAASRNTFMQLILRADAGPFYDGEDD